MVLAASTPRTTIHRETRVSRHAIPSSRLIACDHRKKQQASATPMPRKEGVSNIKPRYPNRPACCCGLLPQIASIRCNLSFACDRHAWSHLVGVSDRRWCCSNKCLHTYLTLFLVLCLCAWLLCLIVVGGLSWHDCPPKVPRKGITVTGS